MECVGLGGGEPLDCHYDYRIRLPNRMEMLHSIPLADTSTGSPLKIPYRSHGTGSPTQTSKMFDPTEDDTAMSPSPLRATITLVIRSGIEVPATS